MRFWCHQPTHPQQSGERPGQGRGQAYPSDDLDQPADLALQRGALRLDGAQRGADTAQLGAGARGVDQRDPLPLDHQGAGKHPRRRVPARPAHARRSHVLGGGGLAHRHRIGVEEVRGEDRLGLPGQERPPGLPGSPGRGVDAGVLEDPPHCRRRDFIAQPSQLTLDAPVAPARIVPRHLQYKCADGRRDARPSRSAARAGPPPPDQVRVPAQQGPRGDDQAQLAEAVPGEQPSQRSQELASAIPQDERLITSPMAA